MVQSTITLGYVILFGAVAPIVVPLCFAVLMIEVRGTAFFLTTHARRPFPAKAMGTCAWQKVVHKLMRVGVLWSGILLAEFGYLLRGEENITKISFVFLFSISMLTIWGFVDLCFSQGSSLVRLMGLRRKRVLDCLAAECAEAVEQKAREVSRAGDDEESGDEVTRTSTDLLCKEGQGEDDELVEMGEWDSIMSFSEAVAYEEQARMRGNQAVLNRTHSLLEDEDED